jgi:hypothetical protein
VVYIEQKETLYRTSRCTANFENGLGLSFGRQVAARQPLVVLVRYVLDDGVRREVRLISSTGLEEGGQ